MFNWLKKLFGSQEPQQISTPQPLAVSETTSQFQAPIIAQPPTTVVAEPVATVSEIASVAEVVSIPEIESAGKKPAKKEKKTPAKPKKKAQAEVTFSAPVVETPARKTKKVAAQAVTIKPSKIKKK